MLKDLVIIGAGGVGREIAAVLKKFPLENYSLYGFVDDSLTPGSLVNGLEVLGGLQWLKDNSDNTAAILAIGNPQVRKKIIDSLSNYNLDFPTLIHPGASIHDVSSVIIGKGCYVADKCVLTVDVVVSDFCFLNTACVLQHDTVVGSYSVLMPNASITGGATLGEQVYVASNCALTVKCNIQDKEIIKQSLHN